MNTDIRTEILKAQRETLGLNKTEVARRVGISRMQYHRIEEGLSGVKISTLRAIASALDIPLPTLLKTEVFLPEPAHSA